MGEYEPDDSRKVTQNPGNTPGEPPRTGPREGEARARAEDKGKKPVATNEAVPVDRDGKRLPQQQQKARQSQSQGSQSQAQGSARQGDSRELNSQQPEGSPLAGNQPQGASGTPGAARPHFDQYEVNQPSNLGTNDSAAPEQQAGGTIENAAPDQAPEMYTPTDQQQPGDTERQRAQAEQQSDGKAQTGYGNSRDEHGESEKEAAREGTGEGGSEAGSSGNDDVDAQDRGKPGLTDTPDGVARADGNRALYEGPGE